MTVVQAFDLTHVYDATSPRSVWQHRAGLSSAPGAIFPRRYSRGCSSERSSPGITPSATNRCASSWRLSCTTSIHEPRTDYRAASADHGRCGNSTSMQSPGQTSPLRRTTASTPARNITPWLGANSEHGRTLRLTDQELNKSFSRYRKQLRCDIVPNSKRASASPSSIAIWACTMPALEDGTDMRRHEFIMLLGGGVLDRLRRRRNSRR